MSSATTFAAVFARAPDSTSVRTASTAAGSRPVGRGRAADDDDDLAARVLGRVLGGELGGAAADDLLVQLGELAADRDRALRVELGQHGQRRADPRAATRTRPASPASRTTASSAPRLRGRKPAKRQTSDGSALATSAVRALDGPGSTSTASPAATQPCTQREARDR